MSLVRKQHSACQLLLLALLSITSFASDAATPWTAPHFTIDPKVLYEQASESAAPEGTNVAVLDDEEGYSFDASGRGLYTEYTVYKVTQQGAEGWSSISVTIALMCTCFGLRISECLALRWADIDWLNGQLRVERGIVERNVDDVKTDESRKSLAIAGELLERLKLWRQATEFSKDSDWIFASPAKIGRLPYSYTGVWRELDRASEAAGLGHMGTHTFRHSYRMWIDAIGTPIGVQQKLMRHSDIRTTMNIYGDAASADMRKAHSKIVQLAMQSELTAGESAGVDS